jgi:hypothetical protein
MIRHPGDELRAKYGLTGILTLPPEEGGIRELLCDMEVCYCPLGRASFDPIPEPMPDPIPDWIPTEDHYPRSKAAGGRRLPGNVRLAHRRCNRDDFGSGPGHERKRLRARDEMARLREDHPEATANARAVAAAQKRWEASLHLSIVPRLERMTAHSMTFDGALLERGFWLYVWRIVTGTKAVLYVGRTGDSSSPNASSPFKRVGQHLEVGPNAKGNAMGRQLQALGIDPTSCRFEMVAIGPIFPEQSDMGQHQPIRDLVAGQETALAGLLSTRGYTVVGSHPAPRVYDRGLFARVCELIDEEFPAILP